MKIRKTIFGALLVVAASVGLVACSSDNYSRAGEPDGSQVYFSNAASSEYLLNENQNEVDVTINRQVTDEAQTVNITATDESGLFTISKTATFAAGSAYAVIPITFDFAKLESDKGYDITLNIEDNTTVYGDASKTITIKYAPWTDWTPYGWSYPSTIKDFSQWESAYASASSWSELAKGGSAGLPVFTYSGYYSGDGTQPIFYRESQLDKDKAQLLLYDWGSGINLTLDWDKKKNLITCPATYFANNSTYGAVYVSDGLQYWNNVRGQSYTYDDFPSNYDEENGLFSFYFAYYVSAGYFADGSTPETLQLPGYTKADYSIGLEDVDSWGYDGNQGETIDFTFGTDVGSVKYALVKGELSASEAAVQAASIVDGSLASITTKEGGKKAVAVPSAGFYTLVVCTYDNDGAYQSYDYITFGCNLTYSAVGTGTYDSKFLLESTIAANIYQCDQDLSLYAIACDSLVLFFNMDDNNNVVVKDQDTGYDSSSYGDIYVADYYLTYDNSKYYSSFDGASTFTFANVYYCSAGVFWNPAKKGCETFVLDASAAKKIKAGVKAKSTGAKKTFQFKAVQASKKKNIMHSNTTLIEKPGMKLSK